MHFARRVRALLPAAAALLAACGGGAPPDRVPSAAGAERPNLLVYMVDTLRADELGCYGAATTETPALDRFASAGTLFESAHSPSANTRASVASLFTGLTPFVHGAENNRSDLGGGGRHLPRVAALVREAGYATAAVVANPNVSRVFGFDLGFDVYVELYEREDPRRAARPAELDARAPEVVRAAREVLGRLPEDRPWFLFVLGIDPHSPYSPPGDWATRYDPEADGARDGSLRAIIELDRRLVRGERPSVERMRALYRGEVSYADEHFGRFLDWLDGRGLGDDTVVVFTADHGEEFAEHGLRGHGKSVFEEVTRVPLVLRHPAHFPPARRAERVDLLDLAATLVTLAGAEPPPYWTGRDLRAPLEERPVASTQRNADFAFAAVRVGRWKAMADDRSGETRYYDLERDPGERAPLEGDERARAAAATDPALASFRARAARLREELLAGGAGRSPDDLPADVLESLQRLGYVK